MTRSLYLFSLVLAAQVSFAQLSNGLFLEAGFERALYHLDVDNPTFLEPPETHLPLSIGYWFSIGHHSHRFGYEFKNILIPEPAFDYEWLGTWYSAWGPNYHHSFSYSYEYSFFKPIPWFYLNGGAGVSIGMFQEPVFDTPFTEEWIGQSTLWDSDSNLVMEIQTWERFTSRLSATIHGRLSMNFKLGKHHLAIVAKRTLGLINYHKTNFWYVDGVNEKKGHGIMTSSGSSMSFHLRYQFEF